MTTPSQPDQLGVVAHLSDGEVDAFLGSLAYAPEVTYTLEQLHDAFRKLNCETQLLLVRGVENGSFDSSFVYRQLGMFCYLLHGFAWGEPMDEYISLGEAATIFDNQMYSSLTVLDYFGSVLSSLGHDPLLVYVRVEGVLNAYVDVPGNDFPEISTFRLATEADIAAVASIATYVLVDEYIYSEDDKSLDDADFLVERSGYACSRCPEDDVEGDGMGFDTYSVMHPELEKMLRGRTLEEYEAALRFVRERGIVENSVSVAEFVMEQVATISHSLMSGGL